MRVTTKDFQILKGVTTFEFLKGITIIQGESGNGKSSVFYAIQYALTNENGTASCINHNAKRTEVRLQNNNVDLTWIKTQNSSIYIDNNTGKDYPKASKLDSRDIGDLGFYFDNKNKVVNIHDEWSLLFPFGSSDTDMFKLFEDIFNISCSFQIVEEIKKDEQEIRTQINYLNSEINKNKIKLNQINDILQKVNKQGIDQQIIKLEKTQQFLYQLKQDFDTYKSNVYYKEINVPSDFNTQKLQQQYIQKNEIETDNQRYFKSLNLRDINIPNNVEIDFKTEQISLDFDNYQNAYQSLQQYSNELANLEIEYQKIQQEISQINICPTCGREL